MVVKSISVNLWYQNLTNLIACSQRSCRTPSLYLGPPRDLETDLKHFSNSGAQLVKPQCQKLYLWFCKNEDQTQIDKDYKTNNTYGVLCNRLHCSSFQITLTSSKMVICTHQGLGSLAIRRSNNNLNWSWMISYMQHHVIIEFTRTVSNTCLSEKPPTWYQAKHNGFTRMQCYRLGLVAQNPWEAKAFNCTIINLTKENSRGLF